MDLISNRDLFDLVKSLTKSEKRFLKLNATALNLPSDQLIFFNNLEQKAQLKDNFFEFNNSKGLNSNELNKQLSENLYSFILKCLRSFHAESIISFMIKDEITNVLNLFDKAQYKQCRKILNKQKQEAYRYERFHHVLELTNIEKQLIAVESQFNIKNNTIENIVKEELDVIKKAKNFGTYTLLHSKINLNVKQKDKANSQQDLEIIDSYLNSALLKNKKEAQSIKALLIYHHCRSILFCRCLKNRSREKECLLLLDLMDKNPDFIEEMPKRYLANLNNLINIAYEEKKYKTCRIRIKQLEEKLDLKIFNATDLQLKILIPTLNMKLMINGNSGFSKAAEENITEIEQVLKEYKGRISKDLEWMLYYNIALINIYSSNYSKAQYYISLILSDGNNVLRQDLQSFARIINVILQFELGNKRELSYIISTIKNYYDGSITFYKTEKLIFGYFEELSQTNDAIDVQKLFLRFKQDLEKVMKDPLEKSIFFYFEIDVYIESKIKGIQMTKLLQKKYAKACLK